MKTVQLLEELSNRFGVSGFEDEVREWIAGIVRPMADEVETDILGNLIVRLNPGQDFVLMLDAHMDEIGLIATHIDGSGFVRFTTVGIPIVATCWVDESASPTVSRV